MADNRRIYLKETYLIPRWLVEGERAIVVGTKKKPLKLDGCLYKARIRSNSGIPYIHMDFFSIIDRTKKCIMLRNRALTYSINENEIDKNLYFSTPEKALEQLKKEQLEKLDSAKYDLLVAENTVRFLEDSAFLVQTELKKGEKEK